MATIGAGVGDDPDLDRGEATVATGAEPHLGSHLVACGGANKLFLTREFPFHRPRSPQRGEHAKILCKHFLLAAEPTSDPFGEHVHVPRAQTKDMTELLLGNERRLRTGADMNAPIWCGPGDRTVGFEMRMLHAGGGIDALMHNISGGETFRRVADLAVNVDIDIAVGSDALVMQERCFGLHG